MKQLIGAALTVAVLFGQLDNEAGIKDALASSLMSLRNPDRDAKQPSRNRCISRGEQR